MNLMNPRGNNNKYQQGLDPVTLNNEIRTYYDVHKKSLTNWTYSIDMAQDVPGMNVMPIVAPLQDVFEYVMLDRSLKGLIMNMKAIIKAQQFQLIDSEGEPLVDLTKRLDRPWFEKWLDYTLDSYYYGWSLMQLGRLNDKGDISDVYLLERRNTLPTRKLFLKDAYNNMGESWDITNPAIADNLCLAYTGDYMTEKRGMLEAAALSVLYKFWSISYWSEHIEEFGKPKKHVETDTTNKEHFDYLKEALEGQSDTIITDLGDKVQLLHTGSSDPYEIYSQNLMFHNDELSKLVLGQTGTSEIGTNYQEASVHNNILKSRGRAVMNYIEDVFNQELLHKLRALGYSIPEDASGEFNVQYMKSAREQMDAIDVLSKHSYRIPAEELSKMFGMTVEDKFDEVQLRTNNTPERNNKNETQEDK